MKLLFMLVGSAILTVGVSAALAATSATYPPPSTETANGLFIVNCPFSHRKQVDPIVNPGPSGTKSAHMHDFLGNRSVDSNSTYASMNVAPTTCTLNGDRAGYWVPTLVAPNGSYVTPRRALIYYRNKPVKYGTTMAFPPDFRLIAGGVGVGPPYAGWSCEQDAKNMVATPPNCGSGLMVLHVKFPNCWNGVSTDSANHRSHVEPDRWVVKTTNLVGELSTPQTIRTIEVEVLGDFSIPAESCTLRESGMASVWHL